MTTGVPISLPGTFNVRDLGGMPTESGTSIAAGRLFRGELLAYPGASPVHAQWDVRNSAAFGLLKVATVIDLRGAAEAIETPSAWAEALGGATVVSLPIDDGGAGADVDYVKLLLTRELDRFTPEHMSRHYTALLDRRAETFAAGVRAIASSPPALVHCAAGKDRTGLLIALVLDSLGVAEADIVADYALSGELNPGRAMDYRQPFDVAGVEFEDFRVLFETPPEAMADALAHLRSVYGSSARYLTIAGGLDPAVLDELRNALLEP